MTNLDPSLNATTLHISAQQEVDVIDLRTLSQPGVIGFFTHFEVTEIVAFIGSELPINVLTVLVAEEREECGMGGLQWLGGRISVSGLKNMKFGICRYQRTVADVLSAVDQLKTGGDWQLSGHTLRLGSTKLMAPQFVPADSNQVVTLNKILKNNFWNGGYVVEFFDHTKAELKPLFDTPEFLLKLSEKVSKHIPIKIAEAADRLGNLVFQLPIDLIRTLTTVERGTETLSVELAWHPSATPRPLTLNCITEFDKLVSGFNVISLAEGVNKVSMPTLVDEHRLTIWDSITGVILGATRPSSFIQRISLGMSISAKDRIFNMPDGKQERVGLRAAQSSNVIGDAPKPHREWVLKRIHDEEADSLAAQRRFKQYLPVLGNGNAEHLRAISDLRFLINTYGEGGVWLWDPYLSASDILKTLFYCPYEGVQMRAMGNAQSGRGLTGEKSVQVWIDNQRSAFAGCQSDYNGLDLEFRARHGDAGWDFHDRFLIFPGTREGVLVWSLGISVNQFGKSHHILQRVDNGRMIAEAFSSLWAKLETADHLVWKWPEETHSC